MKELDPSTLYGCIQAIFYNDPDCYSPIINGVRLLAQAGFAVHLLCRDNGEEWHVSYPANKRVRRIGTRSGSSWKYALVPGYYEHMSDISAEKPLGNWRRGPFVTAPPGDLQ